MKKLLGLALLVLVLSPAVGSRERWSYLDPAPPPPQRVRASAPFCTFLFYCYTPEQIAAAAAGGYKLR